MRVGAGLARACLPLALLLAGGCARSPEPAALTPARACRSLSARRARLRRHRPRRSSRSAAARRPRLARERHPGARADARARPARGAARQPAAARGFAARARVDPGLKPPVLRAPGTLALPSGWSGPRASVELDVRVDESGRVSDALRSPPGAPTRSWSRRRAAAPSGCASTRRCRPGGRYRCGAGSASTSAGRSDEPPRRARGLGGPGAGPGAGGRAGRRRALALGRRLRPARSFAAHGARAHPRAAHRPQGRAALVPALARARAGGQLRRRAPGAALLRAARVQRRVEREAGPAGRGPAAGRRAGSRAARGPRARGRPGGPGARADRGRCRSPARRSAASPSRACWPRPTCC